MDGLLFIALRESMETTSLWSRYLSTVELLLTLKDTKKRHLEVVQALIEAGADVNAKTAFGDNTPLKICAYYEGNLEVARAPIEKGADVKAKMAGGFTPLYISAQNGHQRSRLP